MGWIAIAIVISTVLLLVDKNQKWKPLRRMMIWCAATAIVLGCAFIAYSRYEDARIDAAAKKFGGVEATNH